MPIGWGMAIGAIGSYLGGQAAGEGARDAGSLQAQAQREGAAETKRQFDIGQENLRPYQQVGARGLAQYEEMINKGKRPTWGGFDRSKMEQDPGYQFRMGQGLEALDRMYSKSGQRFSGARGIGLQQYGQEMASQEYGAARGRAVQDYQLKLGDYTSKLSDYANMATMGQHASGSLSTLGQNYANQYSNILQQGAQDQGGFIQGTANANAAGIIGIGNSITSGMGAYRYQQNFDKYRSSGPSTAAVRAGWQTSPTEQAYGWE